MDKWRFPSIELPPGNFLTVFASGKDRAIAGSELHTNFKLRGSGEYLALVDQDGTVSSEYAPEFPEQRSDISFGLAGASSPLAGQLVYLAEPTPGQENVSGALGFVDDPSVDIAHGFYNEPIDVTLTTDTSGATIRYTLDGSLPTLDDGFDYTDPIPITTTTTLRATAFKDAYSPSGTNTQTYIFPDDVIRQPALPEGFPADWGRHPTFRSTTGTTRKTIADYDMIQSVVDDPRYADEMIDALTVIPTVSLVMNVEDFFGTNGIYSKPGKRTSFLFYASLAFADDLEKGFVPDGLRNRFDEQGLPLTAHATASFEEQGESWHIIDLKNSYSVIGEPSRLAIHSSSEWTRPASVEFMDTGGSEGFQIDAGIRMHGGWGRSPHWTSKHSFRVLFKSEFGPSKLEYPLFGADATDRFDQLVLRAEFQDSWPSKLSRGSRAILIRDEMARRSNLAAGQPDPHGRFVHLYLNGLYWGIYNIVERPNNAFGEAYFGGDKDQYDAISQGDIADGNDLAWKAMFDIANDGERAISLLQLPSPLSGELRVGATVKGPAHEYGYKSNALIIFDYHSQTDFKFIGGFFGADRWRIGHVKRDTWTFDAEVSGSLPYNEYDIDVTIQDTRAILAVDGITTLSHDFGQTLTDGDIGLGTEFAIASFDNIHVSGATSDRELVAYIEDFEDAVVDHLEPISGLWQIDDGWYQVMPGLASPERYQSIQQYLDIPNLVGHMVVNYYLGAYDWPHKGFWALRERDADAGFKFVSWDKEGTMIHLTDNRTVIDVDYSPARLTHKLRGNSEFRIFFADEIQRHLFNDGALTLQNNRIRLQQLKDEMDTAILAESARWGRGYLNRDDHWLPELDRLLNDYLPERHDIVLQQFRDMDLWPSLDATVFNQHGGQVAEDFELQIRNPNRRGKIYYRLDGGDPRETGGAISDNAIEYSDPITLTDDVKVNARIRHGSTWSAINEAEFLVGHVAASAVNLVVTELNYHPHAADAARGELDENADEFEFIELLNLGSRAVDLTDLQFTDGITFNFNDGVVASLAPGARVLVVENQAAFESRYGADLKVAGQYSGRLSNGGETIRLEDAQNKVIVEFTYDNGADWPQGADGQGRSLEVIDSEANHNDPANWRASTEHGGSPGTAGIGATVAVVGRHIFYNSSSFDGNDASTNANDDDAIAPDKTALLPGQTAGFQNYTSYSRGINGVMVDIANLAAAGAINADDFEFRVGNNDDPSTWSTLEAPPLEVSVRQRASIDGSDRVTIVWDNNAIEKQWLQVTVLPTSDTGLSAPDVHYWGNAIGDSGDSMHNAHVTATDELAARFNPHTFIDPALIDDVADYNRDRLVDATDELTARFNATNLVTSLKRFTLPAPGSMPTMDSRREPSADSQADLMRGITSRRKSSLQIVPRPTWLDSARSSSEGYSLEKDDVVDLLTGLRDTPFDVGDIPI